ncbi:hypothetical protein LCGC14_1829780 [marine sediment metagenome]|uniref:Uncharacterized protein n=1 Tax=marine sediment metagenome TaxID=412755 RepID=A0A0F9JG08_9ZZZZ
MSPTKLKKAELKDVLLKMGHDPDDINKMKRPALLELYSSENVGQSAEVALGGVVVEEDKATPTTGPETQFPGDDKTVSEVPERSSKEWTQYVLGKFLDDELEGENPRVDGLRRVAQEVIGTIVEEGCDLVACPTVENGMRACVKAWVVFENEQRFESLADASPTNITGEEYAMYLTAMADTRAKGRCFRNALGLKRVVAAEELSNRIGLGVDGNTEGAIHTGQITAIHLVADRIKVSVPKLLEDMKIECTTLDNGSLNLKTLKHEEAVSILQKLQELSASGKIPDKVKE